MNFRDTLFHMPNLSDADGASYSCFCIFLSPILKLHKKEKKKKNLRKLVLRRWELSPDMDLLDSVHCTTLVASAKFWQFLLEVQHFCCFSMAIVFEESTHYQDNLFCMWLPVSSVLVSVKQISRSRWPRTAFSTTHWYIDTAGS